MPVSVSLYELVLVKDSRRAWPADFHNLVAACEKDVSDRLPFGVVADWLDENKEPELASAFRWLHKRPEVAIESQKSYRGEPYHMLRNQPRLLGTVEGDIGFGLIGVVVKLAEVLQEIRRDAE